MPICRHQKLCILRGHPRSKQDQPFKPSNISTSWPRATIMLLISCISWMFAKEWSNKVCSTVLAWESKPNRHFHFRDMLGIILSCLLWLLLIRLKIGEMLTRLWLRRTYLKIRLTQDEMTKTETKATFETPTCLKPTLDNNTASPTQIIKAPAFKTT